MRRLALAGLGVVVAVAAAVALSSSALEPPSSPAAAAGDQLVTLTWQPGGSSGVTGYRVYRRLASGTWPTTPLTKTRGSVLRYSDTGLSNGTAYAYRVTSLAGTRESKPSAIVSATPRAGAASPCGRTSAAPAHYDHVVWVVMENKAYDAIIGSPSAPYENELAKQCASAANFLAESHPSLPNYIAMTSGSPQGISDDNPPSSHRLDVPSIFSQLGRSWRSLQESMPSNCLLTSSGQYAVKHNPAAYYTNVRSDCNAHDVRLADPPDISARFTFVTPNLCNDTHSCSAATGDAWLQTFLGKVFGSAEYQAGSTAVFLTWDEDDSSHSNHIATIVAAPSVVAGSAPTATFNHYSMLRTTEEMLGLGFVGNAASASSMRGPFGI